MFNNKKQKHLSGEEILNQRKREEEILKDKEEFKKNLEWFRKEYAKLVEEYGMIHGIRWSMPSDLDPSMPFITEVWVKKQVEQAKLNNQVKESLEVRN